MLNKSWSDRFASYQELSDRKSFLDFWDICLLLIPNKLLVFEKPWHLIAKASTLGEIERSFVFLSNSVAISKSK